jgi:hypothetical protein
VTLIVPGKNNVKRPFVSVAIPLHTWMLAPFAISLVLL